MPAPLTLVEKIATRYALGLAPGAVARQGDFVTIRPKHVMTHDNTGAVIPKFKQITGGGAAEIHDPRQPVFAIDHDIQNTTPENLGKYLKIEKFAEEHGVDFYPAGTGISHQVMVEQGYVVPGAMVVGSDSHSNLYGAIAALGTPVVRTDAASIWATGTTWWQVPPVARVVLTGRLQPGVVGKDVIVALCGLFNHDEVLNHAVEFAGEGVACLTIDQRMSIANMTTEWGALAGVFPFDEVLRDYLLSRADYFARSNGAHRPGKRHPGSPGGYTREDVEAWYRSSPVAVSGGGGGGMSGASAGGGIGRLCADPGARYAVELTLDLSTIVPYVSGPNDVKTMHSLPEIEQRRVKINKAWLMSCVNARYEDIAAAANIVKGKKVAEGVEFYLAAASAEVQKRAEADGHWQSLLAAGAIPLPPGCGTCIGLGRGTIKKGEVGISSTNRNFEGRMGDREGLVYLGSPAVVAASAVAGYICAPTRFSDGKPRFSIKRHDHSEPSAQAEGVSPSSVEIIEGFPAHLRGRLIFLDRDNLNTDGIYAGKWTYKDDLTPEQMAAVIFENYDPGLRPQLRPGDVIVGGFNFGTGSSREQAATALKHAGIPCVIAGSFSETYKRNAFNNGFPVFECPALIGHLRAAHRSSPVTDGGGGTSEASAGGGGPSPTHILPDIDIDFASSTIRFDNKSFPFPPLSPIAQELVVAGGAENVIRGRLAQRA